MSANLSQIDQANLKKRINSSAPITLRQRVEACLLLFELYESHLNVQFINKFIKAHGGRNCAGPVRVLYDKLLEKRILKNREKIRAKKRGPQPNTTPPGATMKVPGSDGKLHWSDGANDLGVVVEQAAAEEKPFKMPMPWLEVEKDSE